MTPIITGNFQQQEQVDKALSDLGGAGFDRAEMSRFLVGAPQNQVLPVDRNQTESPGTDPAMAGALSGAGIGGAVGVAVGLVTLPLLGPGAAIAGVGAGAYVGSLVGALSALGDPENPDLRDELEALETTDLPRKPGTLVAVAVPVPARMNEAIRILRASGGTDVDVSQGTIVNGQWTDFDPAEPLNLVVG